MRVLVPVCKCSWKEIILDYCGQSVSHNVSPFVLKKKKRYKSIEEKIEMLKRSLSSCCEEKIIRVVVSWLMTCDRRRTRARWWWVVVGRYCCCWYSSVNLKLLSQADCSSAQQLRSLSPHVATFRGGSSINSTWTAAHGVMHCFPSMHVDDYASVCWKENATCCCRHEHCLRLI